MASLPTLTSAFLCLQHREATKNILEDEWFSSIAACFHDMRSHWAKPGSGKPHIFSQPAMRRTRL